MFKQNADSALITAVMPVASAQRTVAAVTSRAGANLLAWTARGTELHDHWWKRWLPAVSPERTALSAIVPQQDAPAVVDEIVEVARLHQQATGAVFSIPCEHSYFGDGYHCWQETPSATANESMAGRLAIIHCIVDHRLSDRVSRAAIAAGAHGPIVYYSEGRGIRDRLGWLRITKEPEKEVLTVIADEGDAEDIFDAMAAAGQLHLPGRGFMYRQDADRGLFNLPSRFSHHHYAANMQQIINAIDHLAGHTHWRDQAVADVGIGGRSAGIGLRPQASTLEDQRCLTTIVNRDDLATVMDLLLDAGAPGLNVHHGRLLAELAGHAEEHLAGARINEEYSVLRCITSTGRVSKLAEVMENNAASLGVRDLCVLVTAAPKVATYIPGATDYRAPGLRVA
ncbi:MAG: hypothetical protein AAGE43_08705 [Pseudomonadota bacterium]